MGKSSLLNRLIGEQRVVVSDVPGTTRDAIDVALERDGERFVFVDTAGLRRAGKRSAFVERGSALMTVRAVERAEVALVLMDADEGFTDQDLRVLSLVRERGCAAALVVNKWDLIEADDDPDRARWLDEEIHRRLRPMADTPVLRLSARTGKGVGRLLPLAKQLAAASRLRIPTPELNRWLRESGLPPRAGDGLPRNPAPPDQVLLRDPGRCPSPHLRALLHRPQGGAGPTTSGSWRTACASSSTWPGCPSV